MSSIRQVGFLLHLFVSSGPSLLQDEGRHTLVSLYHAVLPCHMSCLLTPPLTDLCSLYMLTINTNANQKLLGHVQGLKFTLILFDSL